MAFFYFHSYGFNNDTKYPRIIIISVCLLSIIVLLQSYSDIRNEKKAIIDNEDNEDNEISTKEIAIQLVKESEEKAPVMDLAVLIITSIGTLFLWKLISFMGAASICMMTLYLYKKQPLVKSLITTITTVLVIQFLFRNVFTIPLPSPDWWPYF